MAQFTTLDGQGYNIRTNQQSNFFTLPAIVRPMVVIREPGQTLDTFFAGNTLYNQTWLIIETTKPIIPLYYSQSVFGAGGGIIAPQYAFSTPYLCEVKVNGAPTFLQGTPRYRKYASKIAPYCQRVVYSLKTAANQKSFTGDINFVNYDLASFDSTDFLAGGYPSYLFPTDGQKWYLNYVSATNVPAAPTFDSTATLSYIVTPGGFTVETLFMYAEMI